MRWNRYSSTGTHGEGITVHQSIWKNENSIHLKEEAVPARPNFPPIILISSSSSSSSAACCEWACVCVFACLCSQILHSEKDLPGPHWFMLLEANLSVGASLWKAWKLGSSISQDQWEEGAHQQVEPSGWAHTRSFSFKTFFAALSLLPYGCQTVYGYSSVLGLSSGHYFF